MSGQQIEDEIVAKGKTAPRVTIADIESKISSEYFFTAADGVIGAAAVDALHCRHAEVNTEAGETPVIAHQAHCLLTFCVLVMKNGFTVTGESACASPENFDAEIGRKIARQNAVNKIWLLEGYLLKQRLFEAQ